MERRDQLAAAARRLALSLVAVLVAACATTVARPPVSATGTFSGSTADGEAVVLTLTETDRTVRGAGTVGGRPMVLSGGLAWSAVVATRESGGAAGLARLWLSADGDRLTVELESGETVALSRGGSPVPSADGPFSGSFRESGGAVQTVEATIDQHGELLSGVAVIGGRPAGISGRTEGPRRAEAVLTFLDESQLECGLELSGDGRTLTIRGAGLDRTLRRR